MKIIYNQLLSIVSKHDKSVAIAIGVVIALIVAVNLALSPYNKHDRAVTSSIRSLRVSSRLGRMAKFVASVPSYYMPQWHCFTLSSANAKDMFTPILPRSSFRLLGLYVLAYLLLVALLVCVQLSAFVATLIAVYIALLLPSIWLINATNNRHYNNSLRLFNKYVSLIDAYFGSGNRQVTKLADNTDVDNLVSQITLLASSSDEDKYTKISSLLASQPVRDRTPSQQRKINQALNAVVVPPSESVSPKLSHA